MLQKWMLIYQFFIGKEDRMDFKEKEMNLELKETGFRT